MYILEKLLILIIFRKCIAFNYISVNHKYNFNKNLTQKNIMSGYDCRNSKKENYGPAIKPLDPSGKSTEKGILFILANGSVAGISCIDYSKEYLKKYDWESDHMQIYLDTKEYDKWLREEAW